MLRNKQADVAEFMAAVGQNVPDTLCEIDDDTKQLRIRLITEEFEELIEGLNIGGPIDFVACADGIGDLLYVVYGTAVALGIDIEVIWNEIQRSNMSKVEGGWMREDGKWVKPPTYTPPDLEPLIEKMR